MGGGSLDKYHENMGLEILVGMESNSVVPASSKCGGDASILEQLMKLCLSEEPLSDISSTFQDLSVKTGHANGDDWETYLPELNQIYQKVVTKIQQLDSLPQQLKSEQLEKLKMFKTMLERNISFLQVSETNILPTAPLQQGQLPQSHMPQQQSQVSQVQSYENPMQMQSMNMQGSVPRMQQNNMSSMRQKNMSSMAQNNMSIMQLNSLSSLQQNPVSTYPQGNLNALSSQNQYDYSGFLSGSLINNLNNPLQANGNMLQSEQLNQQLQDLQVQQRQLMEKQYQISQSQQQSMGLQRISQIMTNTEPQYPLTYNFVVDSNEFPEPGGQSGHSNGGDDWRSQMQAGSRERIVYKIMETLKRQLPLYGQEDLQTIATGYEEIFYSAALSQSDYMRTISLKMLKIERYSPPMRLPYPRASNRLRVPGASLDSTAAQSGLSSRGDWKEEVYQKIKTMRETYLPDLNQMHQEVVTKLQQLDCLPQQPMPHQVDKLTTLKTMLELLVSVLQVSKTNILRSHNQWLGLNEWLIIHFLAIQPDLLTNVKHLPWEMIHFSLQRQSAQDRFIELPSAKRSREKELVEEVKKHKVEIRKLQQTLLHLVQMQQIQQQQVKEKE